MPRRFKVGRINQKRSRKATSTFANSVMGVGTDIKSLPTDRLMAQERENDPVFHSQRKMGGSIGGIESIIPLFNWPGVKTLVPTTGTTPTFTRATSATFEDFEGLIRTADSSEPRFVGARRVENLLTNSENLNAWSKDASITLTSGVLDPLGGTTAWTVTASAVDQRIYQGLAGAKGISSLWIRRRTGTGNINLIAAGGYAVENNLTASLTSEWQRMVGTALTDGYWILKIAASGDEVDVWHPQWEEVTGQANQNPSDYVSTGVGTGSELITNGDFAADVSGWTALSSTLTWDTGRLKHQADVNSTNAYAYQILPTVVGKTYSLSFDTTAGTLTTGTSYKLGTSVGSVVNGSGVITLGSTTTAVFVATATSTYIQFVGYTSSAPKYFFVDNVSVKEASHGANIDGVQYFDTLNGNNVSGNVVTEATGSALTAATTQFGELAGVAGDYFSSPNIVTTWAGLDLRVRATAPVDTTPRYLIAKDGYPSASRAWSFVTSGGQLDAWYYDSGGTIRDIIASGAAIPFAAGELAWFRLTINTTTGDCKYWTADGNLENPAISDYVQLGVTRNPAGGATSIQAITAPFIVGIDATFTNYPYEGSFYRAQVFNTVDGTTPVVDFTPGSYVSGSTFVSSNTGETWTLNGNATVFQPPVDASGPHGYLSEKASTNIYSYSQSINATNWRNQGASYTDNFSAAPDGTLTATKMSNVTGGQDGFDDYPRDYGYNFNSVMTASIFVKNIDATTFKFNNFVFFATYTFATGVISGTFATANVEKYPNGWLRFSFTYTKANQYHYNAYDITGAIGTSALVWGAQLETGTYPTSYIATAAASVTRNADVLTAGDMVTDAAGSGYAEASSNWATGGENQYPLATDGNGRILYVYSGIPSTLIRAYDGTNVAVSPAGTSYQNRPAPLASTWGNNLTAYKDGVGGTATAYDGTMGTGNLAIGSLNTGANQWNGTIRHVKIFDSELTAAEVADL